MDGDPWAEMRKYVRLEEGHCLSCITEATGIVVFPPDSHGIPCDPHAEELAAIHRESERLTGLHAARTDTRPRCQRCNAPMQPDRRDDARYCSTRCRVAAHRAAKRLAGR